jgi:hypothetical protein
MMVTKCAPPPWIFVIEGLHTDLIHRKITKFSNLHLDAKEDILRIVLSDLATHEL